MTTGLEGRRIVLPRAADQAEEFCRALREAGAVPIVFPTIGIAPLDDYAALDAALLSLASYDWVVFTSANGVRVVCDRVRHSGLPSGVFNHCHVAAIGPATEALLHERGISVSLRPQEYVAEALVAGLIERRIRQAGASCCFKPRAHAMCCATTSSLGAHR